MLFLSWLFAFLLIAPVACALLPHIVRIEAKGQPDSNAFGKQVLLTGDRMNKQRLFQWVSHWALCIRHRA